MGADSIEEQTLFRSRQVQLKVDQCQVFNESTGQLTNISMERLMSDDRSGTSRLSFHLSQQRTGGAKIPVEPTFHALH